MVGESSAWNAVLDQVSRVAPLSRPVLVVGERGTGKELIAARLHYLSERWDNPFLQMNCAAVSDSLLQSELFGHESGAFTGASRRHLGRFERADTGSLFLDELATMTGAVQEQLLRVIEYGAFERVGGQQPVEVDVRLIAATNEDLPSLVKDGRFRADLLDRLAFDVITLPPLRARDDDAVLLAEHFALQMSAELSQPLFTGFSENAIDQIMAYQWPGNVRELKNVVERSIYHHDDDQRPIDKLIIDPFASPYRPTCSSQTAGDAEAKNEILISSGDSHEERPLNVRPVDDFKAYIAEVEREVLSSALENNRYNQRHAAQSLGLTYHQLRALIRKYPEVLGE